MKKPRALDLFCGAGGVTRGLQLAGFHVTGVDIRPQPRYVGDAFIQGNALDVDTEGYDFIWASPPCQAFTMLRHMPTARMHPNLIPQTRRKLVAAGVPWVIENVPGAPLHNPVMLCGTMFDLACDRGELRRHRLFESHGFTLVAPRRACHHSRLTIAVYGHAGGVENRKKNSTPRSHSWERREVMEIDWMTVEQLSQAIPPAYSQFIGQQAMAKLALEMEA